MKIKVLHFILILTFLFSNTGYACLSTVSNPQVGVTFSGATVDRLFVEGDGYSFEANQRAVKIRNFNKNTDEEQLDNGMANVIWELTDLKLSDEKRSALISDLNMFEGVKVKETSDMIRIEYAYHRTEETYKNELAIFSKIEEYAVASTEYVVDTVLMLDCGIDPTDVDRPEGWENDCSTYPNDFNWKERFETEMNQIVESGRLEGVSNEDIRAASEQIVGYDIEIEKENGKWHIVNEDSFAVQLRCGKGLTPTYFDSFDSQSIWHRILLFITNLFK